MADHHILSAGAGHMLTARGNVMDVKAVAAQTGGDFSLLDRTLLDRTLPPGAEAERDLMRRHGMEPA